MKLIRSGFLLAASLVSGFVMQAQTADDIINKSLDAVGGKDKISKINSIHMESTMDIMGGMAQSSTTIVNGKGFKNVIDFNGQKAIQCVTDTGGWMVNPMMGVTGVTPIPAEEAKAARAQLEIGGQLYDYAKKGSTVELQGQEDVNGTNAYKIKLISADSMESTYYFDPVKFLVIKSVMKRSFAGQEMEMTSIYSDYQKTDYGYLVPFSLELQLPQFTIKNTTKKVEINKPVDPAIFKAG